MKKATSVQKMTAASLLIAVGILIPTFSPFKIVLEPASFTLASHVALFLSIFISPFTAAAVALGTTLGFFLGGSPLMVVLRAASQLVFAIVGATLLQRHPTIVNSFAKIQLFSFGLAVLHAIGEVLVVLPFYVNGAMGNVDFWYMMMGLVGLGTLVHSMVDFAIAQMLLKVFSRQKTLQSLFQHSPYFTKPSPVASVKQ